EAKSRHFDMNKDDLAQAIKAVQGEYDERLEALTGCESEQQTGDSFFACAGQVADTLRSCDVTSPLYDQCLADLGSALPPSGGGQLRAAWDSLRGAYLDIEYLQGLIDGIPKRIQFEVDATSAVANTLERNGQLQAAWQYAETIAGSIGVSFGATGASFSYTPGADIIADIREQSTLRQVATDIEIHNIELEKATRLLLLGQVELQRDLIRKTHEFNAQLNAFRRLEAEVKDLVVENRRARAWTESSAANDPSVRLVRDSARLQLADQLAYAAKLSYLAANRAKYSAVKDLDQEASALARFRLADIYRARTAQDIIIYLEKLQHVAEVAASDVGDEAFEIKIAEHLLGLTDENLVVGPYGLKACSDEAKALLDSKEDGQFLFDVVAADEPEFVGALRAGAPGQLQPVELTPQQIAAIQTVFQTSSGIRLSGNLALTPLARVAQGAGQQATRWRIDDGQRVFVVRSQDADIAIYNARVPMPTEDHRQAERGCHFKNWVIQHTDDGGTPGDFSDDRLRFRFSTSLVDKGVFDNVKLQDYDDYWRHRIDGDKATNKGISLELELAPDLPPGNHKISYRDADILQSGLVHLRGRNGCIHEYRLLHPDVIKGLKWPKDVPPDIKKATIRAYALNARGRALHVADGFGGRPVSATEWEIVIKFGKPNADLHNMRPEDLRNIVLHIDTTRAVGAGQCPE
ncbi:MAG: hypothetical protein ACE5LU_14855, partial [Anaerolineae bacterium]